MRTFPRLILLLIALTGCSISNKDDMEWQEGDILFQDIDCGPFCESIEQVTIGYGGARISHCGIFVRDASQNAFVIESGSRGVVYTPLDSFLQRTTDSKGRPKVMIGRINSDYKEFIPDFLRKADSLIGKPYDSYFELNNDALYCSELVWLAFTVNNKPIFDIQPMTFKAPGTDTVFSLWQSYFDELGITVPEGKPGLNPGSISLSGNLRIIRILGSIDGLDQH